MIQEVTQPKTVLIKKDEQKEYGIPSDDWSYLKSLVEAIEVAVPIHLTLFTFFWGISITALFSGLSLPDGVIILDFPAKILYYGTFFISLALGAICGLCAYRDRNKISISKDYTLDYITHLEDKFPDDEMR